MKEENYKLLVSQIEALIAGEKDMIAVMSNVAAAIHQTMGFWWTGATFDETDRKYLEEIAHLLKNTSPRA